MALGALALACLLVLAPLLPAQGQKDTGPKNQRGAKEAGRCEAPSEWDPKLWFTPNLSSYGLENLVELSCAEGYMPSVPQIRCISNGTQATCKETCQRPQWDSRLQLAPDQETYKKNEEVMLSCPARFQPSFTHIKCLGEDQPIINWNPVYTDPWLGRDSRGGWIRIQSSVECMETCQRPQWDSRLRLAPRQEKYKKNEEVMLSCPEGFQPSFTHVRCEKEVQFIDNAKPVYKEAWMGRDTRGDWVRIQSNVECLGKCQKPQWGPKFIFDPDQVLYNPNEVVNIECIEGYWSSAVEIACVKLYSSLESSSSHSGWIVRKDTGRWHPVEGNMTCVEDFQVVPGTLEISSTSIKLNWTCRLPVICQHMRATCRLAVPSSPPCEAEEVKGEEMLHGGEGTFTCPPLQPFTVYSFTISLPPSTVLYTEVLRTKETVPDKPQKLRLDPNTGSLKWEPLPSCKGKIIGYQVNITARRVHNGSFLEFKQVIVNQSVTQYTPPHQIPGIKYMVTVQGLTVTGAGAPSLLEFQSYVSVAGQPRGSWPRTAVLVVVLLAVLVFLSAGILWFVLSRKRKALPSKAEEDHYTELQPYENLDNYCVVRKTLLEEDDAGKGGQAGELFPQVLPVMKPSGDSQRSVGEEKTGWTFPAKY